jgi:ElaB/YqjD/DUF883 family membrane-anchored ribosome-binding protein
MTNTNDRFGSYTASNGEHSAKATAAAMAGAAGEQLADVAGQAQQVAQEQLDNLADAIRRKPIQAAGIAAGVGFLLAMLARR